MTHDRLRRPAQASRRAAAGQLGQEIALVRSLRGESRPAADREHALHPQGCTLTSWYGGADKITSRSSTPAGSPPAPRVILTGLKAADYCDAGSGSPRRGGADLPRPAYGGSADRELRRLSVYPFGRKGFVAGFVDLRPLGPQLAKLCGGGHPWCSLVTTACSMRKVIARSINPSAGSAPLPGAASARNRTRRRARPRRDSAAVSTHHRAGRRLDVLRRHRQDREAVAAGKHLEHRQLRDPILMACSPCCSPRSHLQRAMTDRSSSATPCGATAATRRAGAGRWSARMPALAKRHRGLISSVSQESAERRRAESRLACWRRSSESSRCDHRQVPRHGTIEDWVWSAGADVQLHRSGGRRASVAFLCPPRPRGRASPDARLSSTAAKPSAWRPFASPERRADRSCAHHLADQGSSPGTSSARVDDRGRDIGARMRAGRLRRSSYRPAVQAAPGPDVALRPRHASHFLAVSRAAIARTPPSPSSCGSRSSCARRRRWRPSAASPAASPTTSTTS